MNRINLNTKKKNFEKILTLNIFRYHVWVKFNPQTPLAQIRVDFPLDS